MKNYALAERKAKGRANDGSYSSQPAAFGVNEVRFQILLQILIFY